MCVDFNFNSPRACLNSSSGVVGVVETGITSPLINKTVVGFSEFEVTVIDLLN